MHQSPTATLLLIIGDFRLEYEYEIEYEYDFSNQELLLKIPGQDHHIAQQYCS